MLRTKKSGFTLIELMVVIVIIGVLASLAIPRFTQASDRAKIAEAPRVLASWESAYIALTAEVADVTTLAADEAAFDKPPSSQWFTYEVSGSGPTANVTATTEVSFGKAGGVAIAKGSEMKTTFVPKDNANEHCFSRTANPTQFTSMAKAFFEGGGCAD